MKMVSTREYSNEAVSPQTLLTVAPRFTAVTATVIGNTLEWFDFAAYAFLARMIGAHFFPAESELATMMSVFAAYGVGFITRPLGAVFFGRLGDIRGRKLALLVSMPLMGLGTILVGATPSYVAIGYAAPVLLVLGRLVQGFAAGGEVGNAMAFLSEWAPVRRRGFYASLQQCSALLGTLLGSACAALITIGLSPEQLSSWGWRVPFLIGGLLIAPLGLLLRRYVEETPIFESNTTETMPAPPSAAAWLAGAKVVALCAAWVVSFYTYLIYLPSFLPKYAGVSPATALWANTAGLATMMCCIPLAGTLSDKVGRKPPLVAALILSILTPYPVFTELTKGASIFLVYAVMAGTGALTGVFAGIIPATMTEIFPTTLRTTGVSVSFGLATAVFGGFAPFVSTWLISISGSPIAPAFYLLAAAVVSMAALLSVRETAHSRLL